MMGLIAVVGWEELFSSDWYKGCRVRKRRGGKWITPPGRGFYAVFVDGDYMWGPFDTELEAVSYIVSKATEQTGDGDGATERVLH